MKEKYLKNSAISLVLIVSIILMPLSLLPRKTEAANINTVIGGLSSVITQMPLCQDIGSIKELFTQGSSGSSSSITELSGSLIDKVDLAETDSDGVQVKLSKPVTDALVDSEQRLEKVENDVAATKKNDTCLKSIGRTIIKMLLQKITTDTVSWINGGMEGEPLFVENYEDYFTDIAKYEILGFGKEIGDPKLYPFGKEFMQAQANSFKNKFANNARYSLDEMIRSTNPEFNAYTFSQDFSQGGWAAWDALTQNAANNPLGFSLMASNELAKRIEEKTFIAQGSLQTSGGYLGVQKCVDPVGVTKEEDNNARYGAPDGTNGPFRMCNKWNFVTPGQMVATAALKITHYPENNLLKSEDLNDAVAAILDAFLSHYSSSFMSEGGFAGLSDGENWNTEGEYIVNYDNTTDYNSPRVGQDFSKFQIGASSFLSQNPNFNIRTDLNQALIDEQRIFADKLVEQNRELMSTIPVTSQNTSGGAFTGNYGLLPTIYQLDYCIPGPHPGFEQDSSAALNAALGTIAPMSAGDDELMKKQNNTDELKSTLALAAGAVGAVVGLLAFGVGSVVGAVVGAAVGYAAGLVVDVFSGNTEERLRQYYASKFKLLTGVAVQTCTSGGQENCDQVPANIATLHDYGSFVNAFNVILDRYNQIIYDIYPLDTLPSVTKEATGKYFQLRGYNQMFTNNEARIISMRSIVTRLGEIKIQIEKLNQELKDKEIRDTFGKLAPIEEGTVDIYGDTVLGQQRQYEENLKPWISSFGRISQEMVTGDDIAVVDNTIKQIVDEKDYIYNDLLKGPNGCESDLYNIKGAGGPGLDAKVYNTKRMTYPAPILYDYNKFKHDDVLPDPYKSGYTNKLRGNWPDAVGPGFLSLVPWESRGREACSDELDARGFSKITDLTAPYWIHTPLCFHDLFPIKTWGATVGKSGEDPLKFGIFEIMIGIY